VTQTYQPRSQARSEWGEARIEPGSMGLEATVMNTIMGMQGRYTVEMAGTPYLETGGQLLQETVSRISTLS